MLFLVLLLLLFVVVVVVCWCWCGYGGFWWCYYCWEVFVVDSICVVVVVCWWVGRMDVVVVIFVVGVVVCDC